MQPATKSVLTVDWTMGGLAILLALICSVLTAQVDWSEAQMFRLFAYLVAPLVLTGFAMIIAGILVARRHDADVHAPQLLRTIIWCILGVLGPILLYFGVDLTITEGGSLYYLGVAAILVAIALISGAILVLLVPGKQNATTPEPSPTLNEIEDGPRKRGVGSAIAIVVIVLLLIGGVVAFVKPDLFPGDLFGDDEPRVLAREYGNATLGGVVAGPISLPEPGAATSQEFTTSGQRAQSADLKFSIPAGQTIQITILDEGGNQLVDRTASGNTEIELDGPLTGALTVTLALPDQTVTQSFTVSFEFEYWG